MFKLIYKKKPSTQSTFTPGVWGVTPGAEKGGVGGGASTVFHLQKFPSEGVSSTALSSRANTSIFKNCDFNLQDTVKAQTNTLPAV